MSGDPVEPAPTGARRVLVLADSDSYVKWGAALGDRMPGGDWSPELLVLESPLAPSPAQLAAAVVGTRWQSAEPARVDLAGFSDRVAARRPDVVMLTLRGPMVKVALRVALAAAESVGAPRPVFVGGLPGISIPATRRAIAYRAQLDLSVLHSRREVREFGELAARMRVPQRFGLASLPFLTTSAAGAARADGALIFAAQAKVPAARSDRLRLLGALAEAARRRPDRRVVIKVRAERGEAQTHAEEHDYRELLGALDPPAPPNLVVEGGAMSAHLAAAGGLVTVSSTAAIEAIGAGVPVLTLEDFGVSAALINTVFDGSGLGGTFDDLIAWRFRHPHQHWLADDYFHGREADDWMRRLDELVTSRDAGLLPLKPQPSGTAGGALRQAWDRKRALGAHDRSLSGAIALAVGRPVLVALRITRRLRRALRPRRPAQTSPRRAEHGTAARSPSPSPAPR